MANLLKDLVITAVALCPEGVNSEAHIQLYKSKEPKPNNKSKEVTLMTFEEIMQSLPEDQAKVIRDEIARSVAKAKPVAEPTEEEVIKSLAPEAQAIILKAKKQAEIAAAALKKAQDDQDNVEAVAKAKEIEGLPAAQEDLVKMYKSLKNADAELCEQVFTILKAAAAVKVDNGAEGDLFKSKGSAAEGTKGTKDDAWQQIEAKADEIAKAQNLGKDVAITKALQENPDLYKAYVQSIR